MRRPKMQRSRPKALSTPRRRRGSYNPPTSSPVECFPGHELSGHRGKHRTLPELQEGDPLVLVLSH